MPAFSGLFPGDAFDGPKQPRIASRLMRTIFLLTIVSIFSATSSLAGLPATAQEFLKENYPGWTIAKFRKHPSLNNVPTTFGDFNGDGKRDYAVAIEKDDRLYILALLAKGRTFEAFNLSAQGGSSRWTIGIGTAPKGSTIYLWDANKEPTVPYKIKTDGVVLFDAEIHSSTFYFENGKFLEGWDR